MKYNLQQLLTNEELLITQKKVQDLLALKNQFLIDWEKSSQLEKKNYFFKLSVARRQASSSLKNEKNLMSWNNTNLLIEQFIVSESPFSIEQIQLINQSICDLNNKARFREVPVYFCSQEGVSSLLIQPQLQEAIAVLNLPFNSDLDFLIRLTFFNIEFIKIHPFIDGNGRTCLAILDWMLIKNNYLPASFERKTDFFFANQENQSNFFFSKLLKTIGNIEYSYELFYNQ